MGSNLLQRIKKRKMVNGRWHDENITVRLINFLRLKQKFKGQKQTIIQGDYKLQSIIILNPQITKWGRPSGSLSMVMTNTLNAGL